MSLHQLFCKNPSIAAETNAPFQLDLDIADLKHVKALRLKVGEHLAVVDASNDYFEVEVIEVRDAELWVKIAQHLDQVIDPVPVYLVQGLAKGEKMDAVLRQVTELGVAGFVPAAMQRSVVQLDAKKAAKRHERYCAIARSASMQSGRAKLPKVSSMLSLKEIAASWQPTDIVLLFWEEAPLERSIVELFNELPDEQLFESNTTLWIVIGPEGGIAPEEVDLIEQSPAQVHLLSLGPTILRTETAGVVSTALTLNLLRARVAKDA